MLSLTGARTVDHAAACGFDLVADCRFDHEELSDADRIWWLFHQLGRACEIVGPDESWSIEIKDFAEGAYGEGWLRSLEDRGYWVDDQAEESLIGPAACEEIRSFLAGHGYGPDFDFQTGEGR